MNIKAITVRYDDQDDEALALIAELTQTSKNKLIIKAIKALIRTESRKLVSEMTSLSEKLTKYAENDPDHDKAIAAFIEGELKVDDPAEGEPFVEPASILEKVSLQLKNA